VIVDLENSFRADRPVLGYRQFRELSRKGRRQRSATGAWPAGGSSPPAPLAQATLNGEAASTLTADGKVATP